MTRQRSWRARVLFSTSVSCRPRTQEVTHAGPRTCWARLTSGSAWRSAERRTTFRPTMKVTSLNIESEKFKRSIPRRSKYRSPTLCLLMNHDYDSTWDNKMVTLNGIRGSSANHLPIIVIVLVTKVVLNNSRQIVVVVIVIANVANGALNYVRLTFVRMWCYWSGISVVSLWRRGFESKVWSYKIKFCCIFFIQTFYS